MRMLCSKWIINWDSIIIRRIFIHLCKRTVFSKTYFSVSIHRSLQCIASPLLPPGSTLISNDFTKCFIPN
jgi:hypothetical protein